MKVLINERLSRHKMKTKEGYLICSDAVLARTGKQTYRKSELFGDSAGDEEIEIDRLPEDVFAETTLASFENKPITIEHPSVDVNTENYHDYAVGFVRDVRKGKDGNSDVIVGDLVFTDQRAIDLIESGEMTELSCGYDCSITQDEHPRQVNILGNHVALCRQGRAGNARIVDTVDDAQTINYEGYELIKQKDGSWLLVETYEYFKTKEEAMKAVRRYIKADSPMVDDANKKLEHIIEYFDVWGYPSRSELQEAVDFYKMSKSDVEHVFGKKYDKSELAKLHTHDSVEDAIVVTPELEKKLQGMAYAMNPRGYCFTILDKVCYGSKDTKTWYAGQIRTVSGDGKRQTHMLCRVVIDGVDTTTDYARALYAAETGKIVLADVEIDHLDGDHSNNSISNMELVDRNENQHRSNARVYARALMKKYGAVSTREITKEFGRKITDLLVKHNGFDNFQFADSVNDNYLGVLPKERRYKYQGYVIIDKGYSSAPVVIEGYPYAKDFRTVEEAKQFIRNGMHDSVHDYSIRRMVKDYANGFAVVKTKDWWTKGLSAYVEAWFGDKDDAMRTRDSLILNDGIDFDVVDCANKRRIIDSVHDEQTVHLDRIFPNETGGSKEELEDLKIMPYGKVTKSQWEAFLRKAKWPYWNDWKTIYEECSREDYWRHNNVVSEDSVHDVEPKEGESEKDFISRFMEATKEEYPDKKQRLAVAYSYWRKTKMHDKSPEDKIDQFLDKLEKTVPYATYVSPVSHTGVSVNFKSRADLEKGIAALEKAGYDVENWDEATGSHYNEAMVWSRTVTFDSVDDAVEDADDNTVLQSIEKILKSIKSTDLRKEYERNKRTGKPEEVLLPSFNSAYDILTHKPEINHTKYGSSVEMSFNLNGAYVDQIARILRQRLQSTIPFKNIDTTRSTMFISLKDSVNCEDSIFERIHEFEIELERNGIDYTYRGCGLYSCSPSDISKVRKIAKANYVKIRVDASGSGCFNVVDSVHDAVPSSQKIISEVKQAGEAWMKKRFGDEWKDFMFGVSADSEDGQLVVHVWAELTYKSLDELSEELDKVIRKYDKEAYFDHETSGRLIAWLNTEVNDSCEDSVHDASYPEECLKEVCEGQHVVVKKLGPNKWRINDDIDGSVYILEVVGKKLIFYDENGKKVVEYKDLDDYRSVFDSVDCEDSVYDEKNEVYSHQLSERLEKAGLEVEEKFAAPWYRGPAFVWINFNGDKKKAKEIAEQFAKEISKSYFRVKVELPYDNEIRLLHDSIKPHDSIVIRKSSGEKFKVLKVPGDGYVYLASLFDSRVVKTVEDSFKEKYRTADERVLDKDISKALEELLESYSTTDYIHFVDDSYLVGAFTGTTNQWAKKSLARFERLKKQLQPAGFKFEIKDRSQPWQEGRYITYVITAPKKITSSTDNSPYANVPMDGDPDRDKANIAESFLNKYGLSYREKPNLEYVSTAFCYYNKSMQSYVIVIHPGRHSYKPVLERCKKMAADLNSIVVSSSIDEVIRIKPKRSISF